MTKLLVGMLHLPPLPGSPLGRSSLDAIESRLLSDAGVLSEAGFDAAILENYGDVPFFKDRVDPVTIAAMTRLAVAVHRGAGDLRLGINVLRNDAAGALAIAFAVDAAFIRVNVARNELSTVDGKRTSPIQDGADGRAPHDPGAPERPGVGSGDRRDDRTNGRDGERGGRRHRHLGNVHRAVSARART